MISWKNPPIYLLYCSTISEAGFGGMAWKVECSHKETMFFALLQMVADYHFDKWRLI